MRTRLLFLAAALVLAVMLCVSPYSYARAQTDPTILARQGELALTARAVASAQAAAAAAARAATAQRQAEVNALNDQATITALQIMQSAATALYWGGQTQTPIAMTAQANQATSTAQAIASATGFAQATGTAQATQTQIAQTATATTVYATVVAQTTADANTQRQIALNQMRQGVYIGGALVLIALTSGLVFISLRLIWAWAKPSLTRPAPVKPVVVVEESEPETAPQGSVSFEPSVAQYMVDTVLQEMGEALRETQ